MIYLVEDEASIRDLVIYTLHNTGFEARGFSCAHDFWPAVQSKLPTLVLLDIMLPGTSGLDIVKQLRSTPATAQLPIILLTAKDSEYDKVIGLDLGADDYLPKPFGMMELIARIKSLLRRTQTATTPAEYQLGSLLVSAVRHTVAIDGVEISLTLKEFDLLVYLLQHTGLVLSRDQLLAAVWGYDFDGGTRTVDVHIQTMRAKLGACGQLIQTIRGVGYKLEEPK